jgi:hypothetical protein
MKSYSTLIIALLLFGLCLFEKQSKQRAIEAQVADKEEINKESAVDYTSQPGELSALWIPNLHITNLTTKDSTITSDQSRIQASL